MFDNFNSKQKKVIIIMGIIAIIVIIYYIYNNIIYSNHRNISDDIMVQSNNVVNNSKIVEDNVENIVIHITGAVKTPGIVKLKEGDRIEDAIEAAGGLSEEADISNVNLAYILEDGLKIIIPSSYDIEIEDDEIIQNNSGKNIIEGDTNIQVKEGNIININKATEIDLETLPGIGPSLATKIILYREENGKFSSIDDIKNVSGIGESKYENIKNYICVK